MSPKQELFCTQFADWATTNQGTDRPREAEGPTEQETERIFKSRKDSTTSLSK